ncbi:MAG: hypothetical protein LAO31_13365 [Acidobacteriia bacterium]|nr:hypothetical protein [Terriglobia bacterium]
MTPRPHPSQPERRSAQAVRVCVPTGFFERLTSACDFRAITQPFFSLYDLRPQSSEGDPVLFFKILFLEYILEVSSDAFQAEFTSHSGLRVFLNINPRTVLPAPGEVVYFRRALGWMGFKSLLERVIREAIRNGLSERDCAILEKRYNNPLVEVIKEPPPYEIEAPIISSSNHPSARDVGLNPPDETEDVMPALSEKNLSELFERIIVPEPPPPIQIAKSPAHAESTLHGAAQMLWGSQPGTQEPGTEAGIKSKRAGVPFEHELSSPSSIREHDQENDPLGVESFFEGIYPVTPRRISRSWGTAGQQEGYVPPLQSRSNETSSATYRQPPKHEGSSSRLQAFYEETRERKDRPREGQESSDLQRRRQAEGNARESASRLQRIEPTVEERMGGQSVDASISGERTPQSSTEHPIPFSQSTQAPKEIIGSEKPLPLRQNQKLPFTNIVPSPRLSLSLSTEFLSRSLYIAVPVLMLLAVYLMIGVLRNVQPGPSTVESARPAPSFRESEQKSTPPSVRPAQPTRTPASEGSRFPTPAKPNQLSNSPRAIAKPSPGEVRPMETSVGSTIKVPANRRPAQVQDGVTEEPKKLTLIRHLRLEHGLDFNPDLYSYRELKDIDDRLEETLKKAAKR